MRHPEQTALRTHGVALGVTALFGLGYLLQIATPLRVNVDSLTYMMMALSGADGLGFLDRGRPAQFPPGYPAWLATLDILGLGSPLWIVLANVLAVFAGCFAAYAALTRSGLLTSREAVWMVPLTLGSFATIKHVTLPMAESVFFMLAMLFAWATASALQQGGKRERWAFVGLVLALGLTAWMTRSVGIVLLIPVVGLFVSATDLVNRAGIAIKKHPVQSAALAMVGIAAFGVTWWWILGTEYYATTHRQLNSWGVGTYLGTAFRLTLVELGEIGVNVPASQLGRLPGASSIMLVVSVTLLLLTLVGLAARRRTFGPLEQLFLAYLALMLVWISVDARFWIPVLPLLFAFAWTGVKTLLPRASKTLGIVYLACFLMVGLGALGYSTRLSLMPDVAFAHQYGEHSFIPGYEAAAGVGSRENLDGMNRRAYDALMRFGRSDQVSPAAARP